MQGEGPTFKHCDDFIHDFEAPMLLRAFLIVNRMPAADKYVLKSAGIDPKLFADLEGTTYRLTMASRMGDVGITKDFEQDMGYDTRVPLEKLSNFRGEP